MCVCMCMLMHTIRTEDLHSYNDSCFRPSDEHDKYFKYCLSMFPLNKHHFCLPFAGGVSVLGVCCASSLKKCG